MSGAPKIPDGPDGQVVRAYFRAAHLDPQQPEHWFMLLKILIAAGSGGRARAGAPRKWAADKYIRLTADFSLLQLKHPKKNDSEICRLLARQRGLKGKRSWESLRRRLHDAKNPAKNESLARVLDDLMAQYANSKEELLAWLNSGFIDVYEDGEGNRWARPRGIELVPK
jgi:hypothetical protein